MIRYPIGISGQTIVLQPAVAAHLRRHQQHRWWQTEAGGQLFAKIDGVEIVIEEATGPRLTDRRSRNSYRPDTRAEQREIVDRHGKGLHFVGDWHTHPVALPSPSDTDLASIAECVRRSSHSLGGFILLIVGTASFPKGLHCSIHDGSNEFVLIAEETQAPAGDLKALQPVTRKRIKHRWI